MIKKKLQKKQNKSVSKTLDIVANIFNNNIIKNKNEQ